jgi:phage head maturation protease
LAEWDTAYINDLPDSAFAVILPGGEKDEDGKTVPRDLRKLPHHNAAGELDMPHLRNGMSREPQTDMPEAMHEQARSHMQSHMEATSASTDVEVEASLGEPIVLNLANETIQTLSATARRIGLRLLPYNEVAVHPHYGALMFEPGAFVTDPASGALDPKSVRLRMDHEDPPTGLGESFTDLPDAPYMEFVVSKTERGNDQLTLAVDGVSRGASVGFSDIKGKTQIRRISGRNVTVYPPRSAVLQEVSTTWSPTFSEAGVMYVLHKEEKGTAPMAEAQETPVSGATITPGIDYDAMAHAIVSAQAKGASESKIDTLLSKFDEMVELQRAQFSVPKGEARKAKLHHWVGVTLKRMAGQSISSGELRELALDDVVTTEQPGLVPTQFTPDYDDLIDQSRPFLSSTRRIEAPSTGTSLVLPIITTRAVAGTQAGGQKTEVTTTATKVGTATFAYQTVLGGADISLQMILRADRSFFDLLTGDMGEAYALDAESKAITALLTGYIDSAGNAHQVNSGGVLDPENPSFGDAWVNAITSGYRRAPDHIWLSAQAVGAFIDAKGPLTNAPLYSNLAASFTAAGGTGGRLSGLIPVYVPALDSSAVDVIIGPSRGFVWAEDPARRLEADRPDVAGRDIALVGGIFPGPRYADAFTTYTVAS